MFPLNDYILVRPVEEEQSSVGWTAMMKVGIETSEVLATGPEGYITCGNEFNKRIKIGDQVRHKHDIEKIKEPIQKGSYYIKYSDILSKF